MNKYEALIEARKIAKSTGIGYAVFWPNANVWTADTRKPSLRGRDTKIIECHENGKEVLA